MIPGNVEKELYNQLSRNVQKQLDRLENLDVYTNKHIHSVPQIVNLLCEKMNYSKEQTKFFVQCAYLHDIGKIFIPPEILQKKGDLTPEEYSIIKTHTSKGAELCESIPELKKYSKAAGCHHENSDGTGYPKGITNVPLEAEIIKVADIYDALVNKRQYKEKIEIIKAIIILKETLIDNKLINKEIFKALIDVIIEKKDVSVEERNLLLNIKSSIV